MRERLPNRRESQTIRVDSPFSSSVHYIVSVGLTNEKQPREVFISSNKVASGMAIAGIEIATLVSIALQHGASLKELHDAMPKNDKGDPEGLGGTVLRAVIEELKL